MELIPLIVRYRPNNCLLGLDQTYARIGDHFWGLVFIGALLTLEGRSNSLYLTQGLILTKKSKLTTDEVVHGLTRATIEMHHIVSKVPRFRSLGPPKKN